MKYVRTAGGVYEVIEECFKPMEDNMVFIPQEGFTKILNQSNTIEELCDEFVCDEMFVYDKTEMEWLVEQGDNVYGAIWTNKGLIYVAKMNKKGEFELL